jgi:hypothetical protein
LAYPYVGRMISSIVDQSQVTYHWRNQGHPDTNGDLGGAYRATKSITCWGANGPDSRCRPRPLPLGPVR